ncbi:MAG: exodeoxyribonuclease VII large subunit [Alphaproteobacteria bacterium]
MIDFENNDLISNRTSEVMSVSEVSLKIKSALENGLGLVKIKGEITGFKKHYSGHLYFSLKDENALISAICWRGNADRLSIAPEEGLEVICSGRITTYQGRSQYQIIVEKMEASGEGALLKLLMERKERLSKEGVFDISRKKKIPLIPEKIGIITSPTGAVIRDMLHRISDRFPRHLLLWPAPVQGDAAPPKIVEAIKGFNRIKDLKLKPDVIIVARGGGSFEDLWAFNDEELARAVAASEIPVISAIGHETDTTLIDYAADVRAPTPSAAAEMVVPVRIDLVSHIKKLEVRALSSWQKFIADRRYNIKNIARALPQPQNLIGELSQQLDDRMERFYNGTKVFLERKESVVFRLKSLLINPEAMINSEKMKIAQLKFRLQTVMENVLSEKRNQLERNGAELENCSFMNILKRGFVLAKDNKGNPIISSINAEKQPEISLNFYDGCVKVVNAGTLRLQQPKRKKDDKNAYEDIQKELF